jgi:membrane fusion protein, multidrug efflux system
MKLSHILAVVLAVVAVGWVLSGQFADDTPAVANVTSGDPETETARPLTEVRVERISAAPYTLELVVTGRTAANRDVEVRVETSGRIAEVQATEGDLLAEGDLIARIAMDDRTERLTRAQALVEQRRLQYEASQELMADGWREETANAEDKADLQSALADLAAIRLDIARTDIIAPFDGVLDNLAIEVGDVVDMNDIVGTLYDLDPIVVEASVSEREVGGIKVGDRGHARLVTGEELDGVIRFVSQVSAPETRTFRIELEVANPDRAVPDGLTADIVLPLATVPAHQISPSVLALADDGTIGVKIVDDADVVRFVPITIVADRPDGIWVAGIPDSATLITVGQDFVADGETVKPVTVAEAP